MLTRDPNRHRFCNEQREQIVRRAFEDLFYVVEFGTAKPALRSGVSMRS